MFGELENKVNGAWKLSVTRLCVHQAKWFLL